MSRTIKVSDISIPCTLGRKRITQFEFEIEDDCSTTSCEKHRDEFRSIINYLEMVFNKFAEHFVFRSRVLYGFIEYRVGLSWNPETHRVSIFMGEDDSGLNKEIEKILLDALLDYMKYFANSKYTYTFVRYFDSNIGKGILGTHEIEG